MKKFLFILLFSVALPVFGHINENPNDPRPVPIVPHQSEQMDFCQMLGARAAWGAAARFHGAPLTFKYVKQALLKDMFYGKTDTPNDGIYLAEGLEEDELADYKHMAAIGWKQGDKWVAEGKEFPGYEFLLATFYAGCMKQSSGFHEVRVASSEALQRELCINKTQVLDAIMDARLVHGLSEEQVLEIDVADQDTAETVKEMIAIAFHTENCGWPEMIHGFFKACVNRAQFECH